MESKGINTHDIINNPCSWEELLTIVNDGNREKGNIDLIQKIKDLSIRIGCEEEDLYNFLTETKVNTGEGFSNGLSLSYVNYFTAIELIERKFGPYLSNSLDFKERLIQIVQVTNEKLKLVLPDNNDNLIYSYEISSINSIFDEYLLSEGIDLEKDDNINEKFNIHLAKLLLNGVENESHPLYNFLKNIYENTNPKISLRWQETNDAEKFYNILNSPSIKYFNARPETIEEEREYLETDELRLKEDGEYSYSILKDGKAIGGITIIKNHHYDHIGEIGYFLDEKYWGQGIATYAVKLIEDFCFNKLNLTRLEAYIQVGHRKSEKVVIKNGFELEGIKKKWMEFENGRMEDVYIYAKV